MSKENKSLQNTNGANNSKLSMNEVSNKIQVMIDKGNSLNYIIGALVGIGVGVKVIIDIFNKLTVNKNWLWGITYGNNNWYKR